ncbi:MAG TPA: hypothetical protein VGO52_07020 [Hyphomonadaceae bacterium]|nr:hypothetical protein [Hyphomonadaceae bacterium]
MMRVALAAFVLLAAGSASAQKPQPEEDISGRWLFQTILVKKGCKIEGDISFKRQGKSDNYTCAFVSTETCGKAPQQNWTKVKQSCTAKLKNGGFEIMSKVEQMLDAGPKEVRETLMDPGGYSPDNFTVRVLSDTVMAGQFFSRNVAAVRFERVLERIS